MVSLFRNCCRVVRQIAPLGLFFIGICCSVSMARSEEATASGHVLDLDGNWYLFANAMAEGSTVKLRKWDAISAHSMIRIIDPTSDNFITVVGPNLDIVLQQYCRKPSACYQPIMLPQPAGAPDVDNEISSIVDRALAILVKEPPLLAMVRMRGGSPQFAEGVVTVVDNTADLGPVMGHVDKGRYTLSLYDNKSENRNGQRAFTFDWDPEKETTVSLGGWTPGLYDILPAASSNGMETSGIAIRVLLCAEPECSHAVSSFQNVRASTDKWIDMASPETIHEFLRAYLAELANSTS
jgi:hypothetical protein